MKLFFTTALISVGLMAWVTLMGSAGKLRGLAPSFFVLFTYFDFYAAMWMLLTLLLLLLFPARPGMLRTTEWFGRYPLPIAIGTTAVLCVGALVFYRAHPLSMDEYSPLFQSRAFAAGHLSGRFPPELLDSLIPKSFQNSFLNVSHETGAAASAYWPSFALLLTPFTWLGMPWACNPVLSGLTIIVIHRLGLKLLGSTDAAGLAVLFTIASPVFFADGISYYSMTAHMLLNGLFALMLLEPTPRRLLLAGLAGSVALTLHNPVPHLLFAAPWILWLCRAERGVRSVAFLAVGYLPLCLLLGVGWFWFSLDLTHQGVSASANTGADALNRVNVFSFPTSTVLLARGIGLAKIWLWAVPGLVVLACIGAWRWRDNVHCRLLTYSALATLLGYLFFPADQGHGWGFRYFHSAWLMLPLLGVAAVTPRPQVRDSGVAAKDKELTSFVVVSALLMLVIGVSVRAMQIREFITDHLAQLPAYTGIEKRIVFVDPTFAFYGRDLVQNDPFLRGDVVRMLSGGGEQENARLARKLHPEFHKVYSDAYGEVWSAGPSRAAR